MEINREEVENLVEKYATDTCEHLYQVWAIMQHFAEKLWEDPDYWWAVWILHDIDRDYIEKDWKKHLKDSLDTIWSEIGMTDELKADIRSHGHFLDWISNEPNTLVRKYINSVDELSGFMWAYFRMLPSDDVMDIKPKSIKKKIKDKSFAAWVDREHLKNCETMLDIPLDDFIEDMKMWLKKYQEQRA